jgi:hypothetical protein
VPYVIRRGPNGGWTAIRGGIGPIAPSTVARGAHGSSDVHGPPSRAALRQTWLTRGMLAMLAAMFGIPVILGYLGHHPYRTEKAHGEPTAWTACQEAVRSHLKAPATARFSSPRLSPGVGAEETQIIAAAVDAQRGDNAWHRTQFVCQASLVGTDWLASIQFITD